MQQDNLLALPFDTPAGEFDSALDGGGAGAAGLDAFKSEAPAAPRLPAAPSGLSGKAKAAIVVRLLLNEGADIPLEELPEELQIELTQQMGKMRLVDRDTLHAVAGEFAEMLDNVGLSFPNGLAGALTAMEGKISRHTAARLRKEAGVRQFGNPWERLKSLEPEELARLAEAESTEIAAVLLSKLDTATAAKMLKHLPGPVARRITYAVRQTGAVSPETVDRIGLSLAAQIEARPDTAFAATPGQRVGAILTEAAADKREEVLTALDEEDQEFASDVRKSIFTYALIARRVEPLDVPRIARIVPVQTLVTAMAFASADEDKESTAFMLENMSTRLANNIRDEIADRGEVRRKEGEAAMTLVVNAVRDMAAGGEIELKPADGSDED